MTHTSARSEILFSSSFTLPPTPPLLLLEVLSTNLITLEVGECVGDLEELELCLVLVQIKLSMFINDLVKQLTSDNKLMITNISLVSMTSTPHW